MRVVGGREEHLVGYQLQSACRRAVEIATLIAGAPLRDRDIEFVMDGQADGPSGGALVTVAVLTHAWRQAPARHHNDW